MKKLGNRGNSVIETFLGLPLLFLMGSGVAFVILLGTLRIWGSHVSYETAICLLEQQSVAICRTKLEKKTALLPRFITSSSFINGGNGFAKVSLELKIHQARLVFREILTNQDLTADLY